MGMIFHTVWGDMAAEAENGRVVELHFPGAVPVDFRLDSQPPPVLAQLAEQVREYLSGHRREFTVPVNPKGSDFMQQVWRQLAAIPFGNVVTYGSIATALSRPGAARAVGMACNRNPVPIVIPCHRVVGAGDKLTGFGGGLDLKRRLLDLEMGGLFARR